MHVGVAWWQLMRGRSSTYRSQRCKREKRGEWRHGFALAIFQQQEQAVRLYRGKTVLAADNHNQVMLRVESRARREDKTEMGGRGLEGVAERYRRYRRRRGKSNPFAIRRTGC